MKTVAYLGIPGSFSHIAARTYFGEADYRGVPTFKLVFDALRNGDAEYGIVPVENSLAGTIYENYDYLNQYLANAVGEVYLHVKHQLLAPSGTQPSEQAIAGIRKVYSHPKALEQCARFFDQHPKIEQIAVSDTAAAAKRVAESNDPSCAAIANKEAARIYGLRMLQDDLQDDPQNYTRFLVLTKNRSVAPDSDKCSILFTIPHKPGSLVSALSFLANHTMNLTKIESRPISGKPFEYVFYVDFEFTPDKVKDIDSILHGFRTVTSTLKVIGFYPKGKR